VSWVTGTTVAAPPAATAAASKELGGEAAGVGWFVAGGVGVAPWAGVLVGVVGIAEVACEGMAPGEVLAELWLLWGGVALCWAGVPAGFSTSMGEASVGGMVDAAAAYKWGAAVVGMTAASWEAGGGSVSIGVEDVSLVHLEVGGLTVVGGGARKGKKLPSLMEGPALFWPWAMVEWKVQPEKLGVL